MANRYVRSTDGNDADDGSTWALAEATLAGAAAADAAGDVIYVSQNHAETPATATLAWAGTNASPVRVLGGNDAAEPPTALSSAPTITVSGTTYTWSGATYAYGLNWTFSSASSFAPTFNSSGGFNEVFDTCAFIISGAGTSTNFQFGSGSGSTHSKTELRNCQFKFAHAGQRITADRDLHILGGSWQAAGTNPTGVFSIASSRPTYLLVDGFDFSNLGSTVNLVQALGDGSTRALFRNCKLPASWTGSLVASGQIKLGSRVEMHNCDNADTHYRLWIEDYGGTITHETTIVRTGGASDGTTTLSTKMASSANVAYPNSVLYSPEIVKWNTTTGSSVTATIEIVHDSQGAGTGSRFTNAEIWIEVQYQGTIGFPKSTFVTDAPADVLTAATDQTDSTETWTTTGLTTPLKQKLSVSFTPQEAGFVIARVVMAKASKTVYVDHKLTLA